MYFNRSWGELIKFSELRIFSGGVMDLAYVKGFEHRSMAVGLPFVLYNLVPDNDLGERVAVSYALWRRAIDYYEFRESPFGFDRGGVVSLSHLDDLGSALQSDMNALKQFITTEPNAEFEGIFLWKLFGIERAYIKYRFVVFCHCTFIKLFVCNIFQLLTCNNNILI